VIAQLAALLLTAVPMLFANHAGASPELAYLVFYAAGELTKPPTIALADCMPCLASLLALSHQVALVSQCVSAQESFLQLARNEHCALHGGLIRTKFHLALHCHRALGDAHVLYVLCMFDHARCHHQRLRGLLPFKALSQRSRTSTQACSACVGQSTTVPTSAGRAGHDTTSCYRQLLNT
jgi:hypothetical protein